MMIMVIFFLVTDDHNQNFQHIGYHNDNYHFHYTDDHDHLRSGAALQSMNKGTNPVLMRLNSSVMLCPPLPCN